MQTITSLLTSLVAKLGAASPFAKAVGPAAVGVLDILANLIITGGLDRADLSGAVGALVAAAIAYFLPNVPKIVPAPVVPPAPKG